MAKAIIQCDDIVIRHNTKKILGQLSLHVHPGEFWGIVGPNGAGKSTLLKAISGFQTLFSGQISLFGALVSTPKKRSPAAIRKRIGVLLQHHDYYPDLPVTVEDVVFFGRTGLRGIGKSFTNEDRHAVENAIAEFGISPIRKRLYRELSGGEKKKTHLARLIAQQSDILLLDEPTAGLDLDWQERLTLLTENLYRRHGKTIIMVTHDVDRLPSCCNRILLLKNGIILAAGVPGLVLLDKTLSELYGCAIEVRKNNNRYHAYSLGLLEKQ
ncbi:ABC transporter ATP-binding protein [Candidatus Latescibacterota bacterium]